MTNINSKEKIRMSESEMKNLVRNALMVAGHEMGESGDHWPVIKNTIKDVMRDWEQLEIERAVHAEMKRHLYEQLVVMQEILETCQLEIKTDVAPRLAELRDVYDAFFEDVKEDILYLADTEEELYLAEEETPIHLRRADSIIDTLEEE